MTHWGWYWKVKKKHQRKLLCSELPSIDSFKTFKNISNAHFSCEQLAIKGTITPESIHCTITTGPNVDSGYTILLDKQPCNYGGYRTFFRCPHCRLRMRTLYAYQGIFSCRKCLNLGYYSQKVSPSTRYGHMQTKIENKLIQAGGSLHAKPKRMRHQTYSKLQDLHIDYDCKREKAFMQELFSMFGPQALQMLFEPQ